MNVPPPGSHPALVSSRWDLTWFVLPGVAAALAGTAVGLWAPPHRETGLGLWVVGVLLVDVAHVWGSLYRTYLDPDARRLHRRRLWVTPLLCGWFGFLLHLESPLLFWSVLAYIAIFHFIKQHIGFALLYVRAGGESRRDRRLVEAAIWAGTLGPVIHWHAHLPTRFAWFMDGDLIAGLPGPVGRLALLAEVPIWIAFAVRRIGLARRGKANSMVPLLALVPAVNWHLGIVVFDDDRVFTITNVFLHGIPYLALVWLAGGRDLVRSRMPGRGWAAVLTVFYGAVAVLAFGEELLWDHLVWHDHAGVFGDAGIDLSLRPVLLSMAVAVLTVPQATHYILDRFIWRVGPDNPKLADQLGLGPGTP